MTELDDFLVRYRADDNVWWTLSSGDHQNLFDALWERYDNLVSEVAAFLVGEDEDG